ncbi:MAG: hypothetical protein APR63_14835 [Desulfuromonas sp. SDB]|nr:MAG: hypothetical protein APR63_14835 [Desulfuromonas sp. SDB]
MKNKLFYGQYVNKTKKTLQLYKCQYCKRVYDLWDIYECKCLSCGMNISERLCNKILDRLIVLGYIKIEYSKTGQEIKYNVVKEVVQDNERYL